jgi:hypothetical protein
MGRSFEPEFPALLAKRASAPNSAIIGSGVFLLSFPSIRLVVYPGLLIRCLPELRGKGT